MIAREKAKPIALSLVFSAFASFLVACPPPPQTVSLRMGGAPARATVTIDEEPVGSLDVVAAHGVALPPGKHRVTVEAPGYFPWDQIVDAPEGSPLIKLDVKLVPVPD